ncbi:acylphosphatase [Pseudodesulfovibrio portus]|uniref:Acylphosphatase n=1 Tax=Pseudodesulfovibrio portus TaxID=231439 RepID=A0ABM8AQQ5_9BACT|nr:acylphosphatase [Pseudodesulfovibrio portus]BDQ33753.1 acylphosphatase [Pseudodesulfovibrio portus]
MQLRATVHGKVQGVWFRAWTRDTATNLGLTGWVRNLPSGDVETLADGTREQLEEFILRLWDGPPLARVTDIRSEWSEADNDFTAFTVRR